jgi:serine/threonine protein kinase
MLMKLSSANVIDYLSQKGLYKKKLLTINRIKGKSSKNFNLLVEVVEEPQLLVKQERYVQMGKVRGDFIDEWRIHELLETFTELSPIRSLICEPIYFDPEQGIIVFPYLDNYQDLGKMYDEDRIFNPQIAASLGKTIGLIHRQTIHQNNYKDFLSEKRRNPIDKPPNYLRRIEKIEPEIFGRVTSEALEFFRLYQLYDSLGDAIANLQKNYQPCCLIHDDLSLDNVLIRQDCLDLLSLDAPQEAREIPELVKIIDWELCRWGDPIADLGKLLSSYLKLWLKSLSVSADIEIELALRLATIPLYQIQPSLTACTRGYLTTFPQVEQLYPDFWVTLVQFIGLDLFKSLSIKISYQRPFDNIDICMLQVAKSLLCDPKNSMTTVFGMDVSEIYQYQYRFN